ncbi:phosphopantothenoylcysteine decarboxylase/phosphopantothenate/cysteine ligase [Candidatus Omnitrophus magneticus]|uniref:Phosphopantothenoylcysteine decarboxylase/phosphopantothenate/cysteine ligase n=1 Tax=Candidatus Omnitrophus magneticus TaxID=1609969 RepID=A0A0F0CMI8_9BACT|nr:phosphopantothenoylcysteine decarboxylase/phosphopantothenate/cysteine ligase [Candidatus Omnitrophus magneticus]
MNKKNDFSSFRILVTAGPTIEPIDPVRFISNFSTGTMGYKIAFQAKAYGAKVTLVSGPVNIIPPKNIDVISIQTAREMRDIILKKINDVDCIIMSSAVCDYRPVEFKNEKIKKKGKKISLELTENPDILEEIGTRDGLIKAGFALETSNAVKNAYKKLKEKKLDLIVYNMVSSSVTPFGENLTTIGIMDKHGNVKEFKNISKDKCAVLILDEIGELLSRGRVKREV